MSDDRIVRARIHPAIGIARVGDSDEYFLGPEVGGQPSEPPGSYKDGAGRLRRQAARFRIYGYDARGTVVKELTLDDASITWRAHVANAKAAWYQFNVAMDIPWTNIPEGVASQRRNPEFVGAERQKLVIDPGPRTISGRKEHGAAYRFDTGRFFDEPVYLGELRTDEVGRLIFLGGHGRSATPFPANRPSTFADNPGWHDDVSDGPVFADVVLKQGGRSIPVDPAWVVTAPPNYAPEMIGVVTMYDVVYDLSLGRWLKPPARVSFTRDIHPLLERFSLMQWVNYGFAVQFGWEAPCDFFRPAYFGALSSNDRAHQEARVQLFNMFRDPAYTSMDPLALPAMYGDGMETDPTNPRQWLAITPTQYANLAAWAKGEFEADWDPSARRPTSLDAVPLAEQPHALDEAALHYCLGGPFHPGCEMTWPMRTPELYYEAFRVRVRDERDPEPDYGDTLSPAYATSDAGPLRAQGPGGLTRWMAVPWQTDTASCLWAYDNTWDEYLPTFWPARVPNQVLSRENYARVMDASLPLAERMRAFNERLSWFRILAGQKHDLIYEMTTEFARLGVIERRPGPGDAAFPPVMHVESSVESRGTLALEIHGLGRSDKGRPRWRRGR